MHLLKTLCYQLYAMDLEVNRPWPQVRDHLLSKYKILLEIDFLYLTKDPQEIYRQLLSVHRNSYAPNERIIVYHYDMDFYLHNRGVYLYNLLQAIRSLQMSPSVFIFLTSHYGISNEIEQYFKDHYYNFDYTNDHMTVWESGYQLLQSTHEPVDTPINIEKIDYPFICLCGQQRSHRVIFLSGLKSLGLLDQGICSWNFNRIRLANKTHISNLVQSVWNNLKYRNKIAQHNMVSVSPNVHTHDDWPVSPALSEYYTTHGNQFVGTSWRHPLIKSGPDSNRFDLPAIKLAFLYVSVETVVNHQYAYFTEKTFKAILMKRPFVIVGTKGTLAQLQRMGFKTFDAFWDESYDQNDNHSQRIEAVLDIVRQISSMSVEQLQEMCYNMSSIIEHNFNNYVINYADRDLKAKLSEL